MLLITETPIPLKDKDTVVTTENDNGVDILARYEVVENNDKFFRIKLVGYKGIPEKQPLPEQISKIYWHKETTPKYYLMKA